MTKKQMKSEIERLELEVERITIRWSGAMESLKNALEAVEEARAEVKQAEACAEEWQRKYMDMLLLNISLAEKLANREDSGCSTT